MFVLVLLSSLFFVLSAVLLVGRATGYSVAWYYRRLLKQWQITLQEFYFFLDSSLLWRLGLSGLAGLAVLIVGMGGSWTVLTIMLILALGAPFLLLQRLRSQRYAHIEQQLPDFVQALAAALQAGTGLQLALQALGARAPAPLGQELRFMLRHMRLGMGMGEALWILHQRTRSSGVLLLRACLELGLHQGGGMGESLQQLALSLRQALHLRLRMRALTAQARLQAWVMCILPFLLAIVLYWLDPQASTSVWLSEVGLGAALLLSVLLFLGIRFIVLILRDLE